MLDALGMATNLRLALALAATIVLAACPDTTLWDESTLVPRDPDLEPPRVVSISLGPLDAPSAPRGVSLSPVIEVMLSEPLDPATLDGDAVVLRGAEGARIEADVTQDGAALRIEPAAALAPRTEHQLVLSGTLRDLHGAPLSDEHGQAAPFEFAFVTGDETAGPPRVDLISPAEGATEVPRNLAEIVVGFSEPVFGRVRLESWTGACDGADRCAIAIPAPLEPDRDYTIDASEARDVEGLSAIGAPTFRTGSTLDESPPRLGPTPCTPVEVVLGPACATVRDVSVRLRVVTDEPALAFVQAGDRRVDGGAVSTSHRLVLSGLAAQTEVTVAIGATDGAGNVALADGLTVQTLPPLAPLVVTEVYADAAGPEPAQEFVEILNVGRVDVALEGFIAADGGGPGRPIAAGSVLGPGQYGLVVSDRFDPASPLDPPVAPAAPLFRVGSSLGTNGLLNAGEPVMLVDPAGHELSRYPALHAPRSGVSVQRVAPDADEAEPDSWREDADVGTTAGAPNSVGG